jgi:UDP-N-acetylglucosamine acyltransferase
MEADDIYNTNATYCRNNVIHETVIIYPNVKMGKGNRIGAYCVIGAPGEIRGTSDSEFEGCVEIGDNNIISELVTIQRPLEKGKVTRVGNGNIIMAHAHIGHDAAIGNNTEICTGTIVGGYATVKDGAKVKLGVTIRNRKMVGENAIVGMGSCVVKDVDAGNVVFGNPAKERK